MVSVNQVMQTGTATANNPTSPTAYETPTAAPTNPTQQVMEGFKQNVQSQVASQPQPKQAPTTNLSEQFHPANTPSPLQDVQTIDLKTASGISAVATAGASGELPSTIDVNNLGTYMHTLNAGKLGNQGEVSAGEVPKGFDVNKGYYGFLPKQCTSYAAWYLNNVEGKTFVDTGNGNAKNWGELAKKQGFSVTGAPAVGSVAVWPTMGSYGHVAVVDSVNSDGTINVSEMNYQPGKYTKRSSVSTSGAQFINK